MKKLFEMAVVMAAAFLTGCTIKIVNETPAVQPQAVAQAPVQQAQTQVASATKTLRTAETQEKDADGKDIQRRCRLTFSDNTIVDIHGKTCPESEEYRAIMNAGAAQQKVTYVTQPAAQQVVYQQPAQQQVATTATTSSSWLSDPLARSAVGAGIGALIGLGVNEVADGDKRDQKKAVFGGGIVGFLVGLFSAPSSGMTQSVGAPGSFYPGYPGAAPLYQQAVYPYSSYSNPDNAYLQYKASAASHAVQMQNFNFNNCGAVHGYYSPLCQR